MLAILLGVSFVAFMLMRALPGDFAMAAAGTTASSPEVLADHPARARARPAGDRAICDLARRARRRRSRHLLRDQAAGARRTARPRFAVTVQLTLDRGGDGDGDRRGHRARRRRGCAAAPTGSCGSSTASCWRVPNFVVATLIVLLAGLYFPRSASSATRRSSTTPRQASAACCCPACRWRWRCR